MVQLDRKTGSHLKMKQGWHPFGTWSISKCHRLATSQPPIEHPQNRGHFGVGVHWTTNLGHLIEDHFTGNPKTRVFTRCISRGPDAQVQKWTQPKTNLCRNGVQRLLYTKDVLALHPHPAPRCPVRERVLALWPRPARYPVLPGASPTLMPILLDAFVVSRLRAVPTLPPMTPSRSASLCSVSSCVSGLL